MKVLTQTEKSALLDMVLSGELSLSQVQEKIKPESNQPLPTPEQVTQLIAGLAGVTLWESEANGQFKASRNISFEGMTKGYRGKSKGQFALRVSNGDDLKTYNPTKFREEVANMMSWAKNLIEVGQTILDRTAPEETES